MTALPKSHNALQTGFEWQRFFCRKRKSCNTSPSSKTLFVSRPSPFTANIKLSCNLVATMPLRKPIVLRDFQ